MTLIKLTSNWTNLKTICSKMILIVTFCLRNVAGIRKKMIIILNSFKQLNNSSTNLSKTKGKHGVRKSMKCYKATTLFFYCMILLLSALPVIVNVQKELIQTFSHLLKRVQSHLHLRIVWKSLFLHRLLTIMLNTQSTDCYYNTSKQCLSMIKLLLPSLPTLIRKA